MLLELTDKEAEFLVNFSEVIQPSELTKKPERLSMQQWWSTPNGKTHLIDIRVHRKYLHLSTADLTKLSRSLYYKDTGYGGRGKPAGYGRYPRAERRAIAIKEAINRLMVQYPQLLDAPSEPGPPAPQRPMMSGDFKPGETWATRFKALEEYNKNKAA